MSTRCNVEIYDSYPSEPGAMLYHHSDGYPDFMRGKLERFLTAAYRHLQEAGYPYWWDSERVAAVIVLLSVEDYDEPLRPFSTDRADRYEPGANKYRHLVPVFQPCLHRHGDIEYVWRVILGPKQGEFTIGYHAV
jgi:hypothetical protein